MTQAIRPASINCARCGTEKKVGRGGPIPTYCSAQCRNALSNERARHDGRYEQRRARARKQAAAQREAIARPCPYCGSLMANSRRVQCGAPECKRLYRNEWQREFQRQYKAEHSVYYSRQYDGGRVKAYPIVCAHCGSEATVTKTTSRFCSTDCWYEAKRQATTRPTRRSSSGAAIATRCAYRSSECAGRYAGVGTAYAAPCVRPGS